MPQIYELLPNKKVFCTLSDYKDLKFISLLTFFCFLGIIYRVEYSFYYENNFYLDLLFYAK